ncbi:MAG: type II toxin-antitoxin system VapC family toxin [Rhodomicrobium sp.]
MPRAVLVLDASLTLSWFFKDERTPGADAVLTEVTENGAVVPALWRLEVANALQMAVRRKRIDAAFRDSALTQLSRLSISTDPDTDAYAWTVILQLADRFQLTLYEAAYLELAGRRGLPLATLDRDFWDASAAFGIALLGVDSTN